MPTVEAVIAANRFGMGARDGEIAAAGRDPRGWLIAQLGHRKMALISNSSLPTSEEAGAAAVEFFMSRRRMQRVGKGENQKSIEMLQAEIRKQQKVLIEDVIARNAHAETTRFSFLERWVRFWSNHFTVSTRKTEILRLVGPYERDAIRKNAFGSFHALLKAAVLHPAMLIYLDNNQSFGPSTRIAKRRKRGLNENLAREVLELHTLGVDGGYHQRDVEEFAKALTGWTIATPPLRNNNLGRTIFEARLHEPGARNILNRRYGESGADQAEAILSDLAAHPSTARNIARKLAVHFIADAPPEEAIDSLATNFIESRGDLTELAKTLINLDAAWAPAPRKFKTPEELLVSTARLLGLRVAYGGDAREIYQSLGQVPFRAPSPEGWPDQAGDWAGPDSIKKRLDWANRAAQREPGRITPEMFVERAFGPTASIETQRAVARAESGVQALTLALMSPEFQRR